MNLSSTYTNNLNQDMADSFKNNNVYSTTETVIGKWIDNKPIYRKVIQTTNVTFNDYTFLTIDNNTNLIKYEVYIRRNNNRLDKYATGATVKMLR